MQTRLPAHADALARSAPKEKPRGESENRRVTGSDCFMRTISGAVNLSNCSGSQRRHAERKSLQSHVTCVTPVSKAKGLSHTGVQLLTLAQHGRAGRGEEGRMKDEGGRRGVGSGLAETSRQVHFKQP